MSSLRALLTQARSISPCILLLASIAMGQGSVMLVGGGAENYNQWSDEPYGWFVEQADSGMIINIDVDEASSWYPNYFIWLGAAESSHAMQIATEAAANDSATYYELVTASGIFIEGGDQWDYVSTWKGTLVEDAIHDVFNSGGAVGGTSAGLAVLGEVVFDAEHGNAYPEDVAYNPYDWYVSFTDDFLTILPGVIADSHFHARGRMGRLVAFLARRIQDHGDTDLVGIGVEEYTAFCIGPTRKGTAYGEEVAIISAGADPTIICQENRPLTFTPIHFDQILHHAQYDLQALTLVETGVFLEPVTMPHPGAPSFTEVTLLGSFEFTGGLGEIQITGLNTDPDNWWYGDLGQVPGEGVVPRSVIIPRLWSDYDFFANRWIGGLFGLATNPYFFALYLDDGCTTAISEDGMLRADTLTYVVDAHGSTHLGLNNYNIPGLAGGVLHFLGPGDSLDLAVLAAPPDTAAPNTIMDLAAVRGTPPSSVVLSWSNPGDDTGVTGYHVYRSEMAHFEPTVGLLAASIDTTGWVDPDGAGDAMVNHFYCVTALDAAANESMPSNGAGAFDLVLPITLSDPHDLEGTKNQ